MKPLQFTLQDGTQVLLRPVIPDDRERIQNGMAALSSESRYFRFFTTAARLSDRQLRYFREVDQHNHVAWVALDSSNPKQPGLGIARFTRTNEEPTVAEMAFAVIDAYQHRGLGTILLAVLYLTAEARGVQVLRSIVLGENTKVSNWLRSLGAAESYEGDEYRLDLTVHRDPALLPPTRSGENFKRAIEAAQAAVRRSDAART
jgi:ribosomal protein S18 acetylase RimI-like enzyme